MFANLIRRIFRRQTRHTLACSKIIPISSAARRHYCEVVRDAIRDNHLSAAHARLVVKFADDAWRDYLRQRPGYKFRTDAERYVVAYAEQLGSWQRHSAMTRPWSHGAA